MRVIFRRCPLVFALLCAIRCGAHRPPSVTSSRSIQQLRAFDLVSRGYDDNCLPLNPQLGWDYLDQPWLNDPNACTWFFFSDDRSRPDRPPCTSHPLDPDLGTDLSTVLEITCSDSPLSFSGHINWGKYFGHAATYEGWLRWEGFSGNWPNDHDLNFTLEMFDGSSLAERVWTSATVELDSREVQKLASPWWRDLLRKVERDKLNVDRHVGIAYARISGLLGIDAEHLSRRDIDFELHPAFAMALRVPCAAGFCAPEVEHWALLARERGNEGLCSHWDRPHVLPLPDGTYTFRLPWKTGATGVSVTLDRSGGKHDPVFCSNGEGRPRVEIAIDSRHEALLVSVSLPAKGIVDGDLYLFWSGGTREALAPPAPVQRHAHRARDLEDPVVAQAHVDQLRRNPSEAGALDRSIDDKGAVCKSVPVTIATNASVGPGRPSARTDPFLDPVCGANVARASTPGAPAARGLPPSGEGAPGQVDSSSLSQHPSAVDQYCDERSGISKDAAKFCAASRGP